MEPEYRGKNLFKDVLMLFNFIGLREGYQGTLSRTSVLATASYLTQKHTFNCIGTIPDGLNVGRDRWVDEMVMYKSYAQGTPLQLVMEVSKC